MLETKVKRYQYGNPFQTDAVVIKLPIYHEPLQKLSHENGNFIYKLEKGAAVYGLGESVRGINKRGWFYTSFCTDDDMHTENKHALYGSHNFLVCNESQPFGIFIDYPGKVHFDIGYTDLDTLMIEPEMMNLDLYLIEGQNVLEIIQTFRTLIGQSYIPPKWAFGYQQSRWSYETADEIREVAYHFKKHEIPLDSIYLDIDYMQNLKDFTVDPHKFPDFENLVAELKEEGIHLIPIIDAGVKAEAGYEIYEEGIKNGYFIKNEDGTPFEAAVWPGKVHFPDFLNKEARTWFGMKYKTFIDKGIEGFWNDMNEPSIFYTPNAMKQAMDSVLENKEKNIDLGLFFGIKDQFSNILNKPEYFKEMYHDTDQGFVCHHEVHNLYGYNMTRAAAEAFDVIKEERMLLFSRASSTGMHRFSGIWTGDNRSWWSHLLLNIKMMPSLNMCGYLYSGADIGGFSDNTTEDLLTRWLQFGIFTPLMRNHTAKYTRAQEPYRFKSMAVMRHFICLRYVLVNHLYSEYMKACLSNTLYFKALAFEYSDDISKEIEDQLLLGDGLMIAPIYEQNKTGRVVYFPEEMLCVRFTTEKTYQLELMKQGHHYVSMPIDQLVIFIRPNHLLILNDEAQNVSQLDNHQIEIIAHVQTTCEGRYYEDNGLVKNPKLEDGLSQININIENNEVGTQWQKSKNSQLNHVTYTVYDAKQNEIFIHTENL